MSNSVLLKIRCLSRKAALSYEGDEKSGKKREKARAIWGIFKQINYVKYRVHLILAIC